MQSILGFFVLRIKKEDLQPDDLGGLAVFLSIDFRARLIQKRPCVIDIPLNITLNLELQFQSFRIAGIRLKQRLRKLDTLSRAFLLVGRPCLLDHRGRTEFLIEHTGALDSTMEAKPRTCLAARRIGPARLRRRSLFNKVAGADGMS